MQGYYVEKGGDGETIIKRKGQDQETLTKTIGENGETVYTGKDGEEVDTGSETLVSCFEEILSPSKEFIQSAMVQGVDAESILNIVIDMLEKAEDQADGLLDAIQKNIGTICLDRVSGWSEYRGTFLGARVEQFEG